MQLAHARLSIIDLSAAADQPLRRGHLTLAYNGELYNYRELRRELAGRGSVFTTTSDTEVVLEAWAQWGTGALSRFRGMYAFAVHDASTGVLTLVRDPLGIKPLYVLRRGRASSSRPSSRPSSPRSARSCAWMRPGMVASALYYWIPDTQCAIQDVHKVAPGSYEQYQSDGTVEHRHLLVGDSRRLVVPPQTGSPTLRR